MRVVPNSYHFKRILRKKTNEESRMKGEYKVECKKWSAKGTYRKASADREPTTHANTLGGQRPRADSNAYAYSARPRLWLPVVLRGRVARVQHFNNIKNNFCHVWGLA